MQSTQSPLMCTENSTENIWPDRCRATGKGKCECPKCVKLVAPHTLSEHEGRSAIIAFFQLHQQMCQRGDSSIIEDSHNTAVLVRACSERRPELFDVFRFVRATSALHAKVLELGDDLFQAPPC